MEIELKFQVPAGRRAALERAVATASARELRLRAVYFDTPDRRLAAAGLALRLRREGDVWVQALKGRGDGVAARLEHEVRLPAGPRGAPTLDPARHDADGAARRALAQALGADGPGALAEVLRTDIRRLHRRVASGGAVIEIALDRGELVAGGRRLPVHEIEFELLAGAPAALPALAQRWVRRHGLWWDVRTKAQRGARLAAGLEGVPPTKAAASPVAAGGDTFGAFAAMVRACLAHALPNLAEIADGRNAPEHLHQLRVGLRRLRSVLREFAAWSGDAERAREIEAAWRAPFARLGAARDLDALAATLLPRLVADGAPALGVAPPGAKARAETPRDVVCSEQVNALALATLALAMPGAGREAPAQDLAVAAAHALRRAWRRTLDGVGHFAQAEPAAQHRTRKRLKRLRYAFEFMLPLYRGKRARTLQRALARAGEALGELNDLHVAQLAYEAMLAQEPRAAFALGWLQAERHHAVARAAKQLARLADAPRPWRGAPGPEPAARPAPPAAPQGPQTPPAPHSPPAPHTPPAPHASEEGAGPT